MFKNLYLVALAALCGLSACQRQQVGGFQRTHTETIARTTPAPAEQPALAVQAAEPVAVAEASQPVEQQTVAAQPTAAPDLVASTDKLVAMAKGTKFEGKALRLKATIENAAASGKLNATPRTLTASEKMVAKMVAKRLNKKIAKAEHGQATQALDKNLKLAIIFAVAAIVLSLIPGVWWLGGIAGIIAVVFFVLWIVNQAG
jgi:pyocin large subunit-like protein